MAMDSRDDDEWLKVPPTEREGYEVLEKFDEFDDANRMVLDQLRQHGANLSKSRHVVHYFYFKAAEDRAKAEIQMVGAGYTTTFGSDVDGERPYSLIAERTGVVNESKMEQESALLTAVCGRHAGFYDGWEAALD